MSSDIFIELGPIGVLYFSGLGLPFFGIHTDLEKSDNKSNSLSHILRNLFLQPTT